MQRTAADALSAMGVDAAVRAQFLSNGGVAALLPLLLSPHTLLVTSALGTIRVNAQSREVAQEFCAKGSVSLSRYLLTYLTLGTFSNAERCSYWLNCLRKLTHYQQLPLRSSSC